MVNTRAKGRKAELEYKKILENRGYLVHIVKMPTKFSKEQDIFGLFDGIAIRDGIIILFQIKSNRKPNLKPFQEFRKKYYAKNLIIVIAIKKDHKGWQEISL